MIVFENVNKTFPSGIVALDEISFEIKDNDFVFIVGHSGAGKTTILKIIQREIVPTSGTVLVENFDITAKDFNQTVSLRRQIGVVFQDFKLLYDKNVFENIALALTVLNLPFKKIKEEVRKALTLVGLSKKEAFFPIQLSMGEQQRVAIARAVVGQRKIILADEPTGNLDLKTSWEIMRLFQKICYDKTIVIATHNIAIVNDFKKRVISLKNGRILKDSKKGEYLL